MVLSVFSERDQWNKKLPIMHLNWKSRTAAMSSLVVVHEPHLLGLFLRWDGMIPARVATGKNSKNAVAVARERS